MAKVAVCWCNSEDCHVNGCKVRRPYPGDVPKFSVVWYPPTSKMTPQEAWPYWSMGGGTRETKLDG